MNQHSNPDKCVACYTCVVQCPVAEVTSKFLGPRMLGPASERFRLLNSGEDNSLSYCANCKNCNISCPQGVDVANINMLARAEYCREHRPSFRDWILAHGELEANLVRWLPSPLVNFGMSNPITKCVLDKIGISKKADLPSFAQKQFPALFKAYKQPALKKKIVFFPGCYVKAYAPETGMDLVWLLNKAGYQVIYPENFCCCGTPLYTNGFAEDARKNAAVNLRELKKWREEGIPVLSLCPSCQLMFRSEIPVYFPELAGELNGNTALDDAQEFILSCIDKGELSLEQAQKDDLDIIYHAPCHLRAQGIGMPGLDILNRLPGVHAVNADAGCCGISGSYGFKKEKYEIGMAIGAPLFQAIKDSGIQQVATDCGTCRVQIIHGTGHPCDHPLHILKSRLDNAR